MYILKLDSVFTYCPVEWQNFILYLENKYYLSDPDLWHPRTKLINEELKNYSAKKKNNENYVPYVEFLNQEDYVIFKLRFL